MPAFENVRNMLQELHLLLEPDKEHKKVFSYVLAVKFCNGKSLKDYLVRAALTMWITKTNEIGIFGPCIGKLV